MEWFFELRLARHLAPFFPFRPVFLWRPLGVSLPVVEKREREKKKRRRGPRVSAHNAPPSPVLSGPILEGARGQAFPLLTPSTEVTAGFHESLEAQTHPPPPHCSPPEPRGSAAALSGAAPNPRDLVLPALASQSLPGRSEWKESSSAGRMRLTSLLSLSVPQASRCSGERHFHQVLRFRASLQPRTWEGSLLISLVNISTCLWPQSGPSWISGPHTAPSLRCLFLPAALT